MLTTNRRRAGRSIITPIPKLLGDNRRFPQCVDQVGSTDTSATPTAALPASVAGDYLVVWWRAHSTLASGTSVPATWTAAVTAASPDASDDTVGCFYKVAGGSEGTTLVFPNMGTSRNFAMAAYRIANAGAPSISTLTTQGAANSTAVPNYDPAAGIKNYLWLVLVSTEDTPTITAISPPWRNFVAAEISTGASGVEVAGAAMRRTASQLTNLWWYFGMTGNSNNKTNLVFAFPPA